MLNEELGVAFVPGVEYCVHGLSPGSDDSHELGVFVSHQFLELGELLPLAFELVGDLFYVSQHIANLSVDPRELLGQGVP